MKKRSCFSYTFESLKEGVMMTMDLKMDMIALPSYQRLSGGNSCCAKPWRVVRYYLESKHGLHQKDRRRRTVIEYFTAESAAAGRQPIADDDFVYPGDVLILQRHPAPAHYKCEPYQPYDFYDPELFYGSEELAMLAALKLVPESEAAVAAHSAWRAKPASAKVHPSSLCGEEKEEVSHGYSSPPLVVAPHLPGVPKTNYSAPTIILSSSSPLSPLPQPPMPAASPTDVIIRASVHSDYTSMAEYFRELSAASAAAAAAVCLYYPGRPRQHMFAECSNDVGGDITNITIGVSSSSLGKTTLSKWLLRDVLGERGGDDDVSAAAKKMLRSPGALVWTREAIAVAKATRAAADKSSCGSMREWFMRLCLVAVEAKETYMTFVCTKKKAL